MSADRTASVAHPDKLFAGLRARMALLGGTLYRVEDDRGLPIFVISKWNLTRELHDLDAVGKWIERSEGRSL